MHLLRHGNTRQRALFTRFVRALGSQSAAKAMAEVFPEDVIDSLDALVAAHISTMDSD